MTLDQQRQLVGIGTVFIQSGLPCLLVLLPAKVAQVRLGFLRVSLITLCCWLLANAYRMSVELPVNFARARARGDETYDGVGGNAVMLVAGWIVPFSVSLLTWAVVTGVKRVRSRIRP